MRLATINNAAKSGQQAIKSGQQAIEDWKEKSEALAEALDDGCAAAERFLEETRERVEDLVYRTSRKIKRNPMAAVAVAFGIGAFVGAVMFARNGRK